MGLMHHLKYVKDPNYRGYVVRRNATMLMKSGGLFDEAKYLYKMFDKRVQIKLKEQKFVFPSGAEIAFAHYENDAAADQWQGIQISSVLYDEATQADEAHILWLLSRLRSKAKMTGKLALTCNPSPDSYLRKWVDWYLYPKDHEFAGRPNPDRDGKVRYFIRKHNQMIWADTEQELFDKYGASCRPMSFQFISATIKDNPPLLELNPDYLTNLENLKYVEKERLLFGNWDARPEGSGYWKRDWCEIVELPPMITERKVRSWDIAGSVPSETNPSPDWTAGTLVSKDKYGTYYVEDVQRFQKRHGEVLQKIIETAKADGADTLIVIPCDPGAAGKAYATSMVRELAEHGFYARTKATNKSKVTRFAPFCAASSAGLVKIVRGAWNEDFLSELEAFDGSRKVKDDQVDSVGDGFMMLASSVQIPTFSPPSDLGKSNQFNF